MKRSFTEKRGAGVLVLLMFGIFAACIMMVLILGANSYKALVTRDEDAVRRRTGVQYIAAKVRDSDVQGQIEVGPFSPYAPHPCVFLHQEIGGEDHVTRIYCYDGCLRELFSAAELEMEPEDGQEIMPASGMTAKLDNGLLTVELRDVKGEASRLVLSLRGREGVGA